MGVAHLITNMSRFPETPSAGTKDILEPRAYDLLSLRVNASVKRGKLFSQV